MLTPAATLRAFGERLASGDADGAASLFTEDATYAEPPAHTFTGRAALHAFIADFAARHRDVSFTVTRLLARPDGQEAAAMWRWAYTRDGDGQRRVYEGACFLTFRSGLIASWQGYSALVG
jgi:ketosteroid isomerase-like protein